MISPCLKVDGESCGLWTNIFRDKNASCEIVKKGFLEKYERRRTSAHTSHTIRAFKFGKRALESLEDSGPRPEHRRGAGTLKLIVFGGIDSGVKPPDDKVGMRRVGTMQPSSEKAAIKKGISVGVPRDGTVVSTNTTPCHHVVSNWKQFDDIFVVVNIRERSWLTRRRIVTECGRPCTKNDAEKMLAKKELTPVKPNRKKQKLEPVAANDEEAIDLT